MKRHQRSRFPRATFALIAIITLTAMLFACAEREEPATATAGTEQVAVTETSEQAQATTWAADLRPINEGLTGPINGEARVSIQGDQVILERQRVRRDRAEHRADRDGERRPGG